MRKLPFQAFDPAAAIKIYHNNLPHWRQLGATYFVTFRLADSIPKDVLTEWEKEKQLYLKANHGIDMDLNGAWKAAFEKLSKTDRDAFVRAFNRKLNVYLDSGKGDCVLADARSAELVKETASNFDGERYDLGGLVVMPNHVHLLLTPYQEHTLEELLQGIKGVSARLINQHLNRKGVLWQKDSYDHIVRNEGQLRKFQAYIHENPSKAGLDPLTCVQHYAEYDVT